MSQRIYCIIGTGGFGRETFCCLKDCLSFSQKDIENNAVFMVDDQFYDQPCVMGLPVIPRSEFLPDRYQVVVAVGNPLDRKEIVNRLPDCTVFASIIHPSAVISNWVTIGDGSVVTAGTILTCDITIGKHAHLNLNTTVGHDCTIGDYFTTAPAVNISGKCDIGDCVYIGTNAAVRDKIKIQDNIVIGMGAVVVNDLLLSGIYMGNPAVFKGKSRSQS